MRTSSPRSAFEPPSTYHSELNHTNPPPNPLLQTNTRPRAIADERNPPTNSSFLVQHPCPFPTHGTTCFSAESTTNSRFLPFTTSQALSRDDWRGLDSCAALHILRTLDCCNYTPSSADGRSTNMSDQLADKLRNTQLRSAAPLPAPLGDNRARLTVIVMGSPPEAKTGRRP